MVLTSRLLYTHLYKYNFIFPLFISLNLSRNHSQASNLKTLKFTLSLPIAISLLRVASKFFYWFNTRFCRQPFKYSLSYTQDHFEFNVGTIAKPREIEKERSKQLKGKTKGGSLDLDRQIWRITIICINPKCIQQFIDLLIIIYTHLYT